jgi:hypothetical protein
MFDFEDRDPQMQTITNRKARIPEFEAYSDKSTALFGGRDPS